MQQKNNFTEKDKRIFQKMKDVVLSIDNSAEIILFGSRARGDYKEDSDYDFLILTDLVADYKLARLIISKTISVQLDEEVVFQDVVRNKYDWENGINSATYLYQNIKQEGYKIC